MSEVLSYVLSRKTLSDVVSIVGMILSILSFQCKDNKKFFITQSLSGACFAVSFLLAGGESITGAYLNFINIFRGWVFGFAPRRAKIPLAILTGALYITATVFTYAGWLSVLVLVAQLAGTIVMCTDNGKVIRIVQLLFVSPAWLTHNIISGVIGAILCEVFAITSTVVSLIRFRKDGFSPAGKGK